MGLGHGRSHLVWFAVIMEMMYDAGRKANFVLDRIVEFCESL